MKQTGPILSPSLAPTGISNLALWLDASDSGTITLDGSNNVSQWDDKSGENNHVTQATPGDRPLTGTRTLNGLNVLEYQDANHNLQSAALTGGDVDVPSTIFVVADETPAHLAVKIVNVGDISIKIDRRKR